MQTKDSLQIMYSLLKSLMYTYQIIYTLISNFNNHNEIASQFKFDDEYDFVIIGAGSAGSVVANRLSEDSSVKILILEAGKNEHLINDCPGVYTMTASTEQDWRYKTEPQHNCFINIEGQCARWSRGKVLGGTSAINGMLYMRGHPKDFDNWKNLGCNGWSYDNILPYFKKSERNTDIEFLSDGLHGDSGLLPVSTRRNVYDPSSDYFIAAAEELGFRKSDLNHINPIGAVNLVQMNVLNGERFSSSKAFLESVFRERNNLHILTQSFVTKILFSKKCAKSVEFRRNSKKYRVKVKKEVILSAGAINSPQILLLSGIGPKTHLKQMNISVVADLSGVGQNLHDHVQFWGNAFTVDSTGPNLWSDISIHSYLTNLTGPFAYFDVMGMIMSSTINPDPKWPDLVLYGMSQPSMPTNDKTGKFMFKTVGLKIDVHKKLYGEYIGKSGFMLQSYLARPKSRGYIKLSSADPYDYPIIQPNYLKHPNDMKVLINAYRLHYVMASTDVFNQNNIKMFETLVPGCEHLFQTVKDLPNGIKLPSDDYLECAIRHMTFPGNDIVGTCKMGSRNDPMAVVNSNLKVYKVCGLRVIDASVMPVITFANTNAPTVMIAERGAQFIKDEYNLR